MRISHKIGIFNFGEPNTFRTTKENESYKLNVSCTLAFLYVISDKEIKKF